MIYHFIIIAFITTCSVFAQTLTGQVVSIADGDTFTLLDADKKQTKIRLHGIDCPENGQSYGNQAKKFVSDRIFKKTVNVVVKDIDRYGRNNFFDLLSSDKICFCKYSTADGLKYLEIPF